MEAFESILGGRKLLHCITDKSSIRSSDDFDNNATFYVKREDDNNNIQNNCATCCLAVAVPC